VESLYSDQPVWSRLPTQILLLELAKTSYRDVSSPLRCLVSHIGILTFSALVLLGISEDPLVSTTEMIIELEICLVFSKPVPSDLDGDLFTFVTEIFF
jgi:hypothetical protein